MTNSEPIQSNAVDSTSSTHPVAFPTLAYISDTNTDSNHLVADVIEGNFF